jgi:hypothetical protein
MKSSFQKYDFFQAQIKIFFKCYLLICLFQTACMSTEMTSQEYLRNKGNEDTSQQPMIDYQLSAFKPLDMFEIRDMKQAFPQDMRINQDLADPNQDDLNLRDANLSDARLFLDQILNDQVFFTDFQLVDQSQPEIDLMLPVCNPQAEICNGVDDDCNGLIDENIQNIGAWSDCNYDNICAQNGVSTRYVETCINGSMNATTESQACQRSTEGLVISQEAWGSCNYQSTCDENANKYRNVNLCRNGIETSERESQACSRNQDGVVVDYGPWGSCSGFSSICDESGTKQRVNTVCSNGGTVSRTQESACSRSSTDNTSCGINRCCWNGSCMVPACLQ